MRSSRRAVPGCMRRPTWQLSCAAQGWGALVARKECHFRRPFRAAKLHPAVWRTLRRMQPCCGACSMWFQARKGCRWGVRSPLEADKNGGSCLPYAWKGHSPPEHTPCDISSSHSLQIERLSAESAAVRGRAL